MVVQCAFRVSFVLQGIEYPVESRIELMAASVRMEKCEDVGADDRIYLKGLISVKELVESNSHKYLSGVV